jgi:Fe2+ or Zn2+ uptake regulation protein
MGDVMTSGLIEKCLKNGIRMTSQRQIILGVLKGSEDHPMLTSYIGALLSKIAQFQLPPSIER